MLRACAACPTGTFQVRATAAICLHAAPHITFFSPSQVRVGETYGLKFPREFGLLLKQLLYFDRYLRLLAPELQVFSDDRVNFRTIGGGANGGMGGGGVGGAGMGGGGGTGSWGATSAAAYSNRR